MVVVSVFQMQKASNLIVNVVQCGSYPCGGRCASGRVCSSRGAPSWPAAREWFEPPRTARFGWTPVSAGAQPA